MAGMEQEVPLLVKVDESIPPPPYHPTQLDETKAKSTVKPDCNHNSDEVIPLPTYDQSQKYEQEGVLEIDNDDEPQHTERSMFTKPPGTCLDFTMFFILCSLFGVVGFIFSMCLAFTTAAEAGALAGLGLTFMFNLFSYEAYIHDSVRLHHMHGGCDMYSGTDDHTKELCIERLSYLTRMLFWAMGIFGVFLLIKGFHRYVLSRRTQMQAVTVSNDSVDSD